MLPRASTAAAFCGALAVFACEGEPNRTPADASSSERVILDAGAADAWAADAGEPPSALPRDAGEARDASASTDATTVDSGHAPDASTDAGAPLWDPRSGPPSRKGIWIWYFQYTGYTARDLAVKCRDDGIGYVLIKSGQDGSYWSQRYNEANVREFTSRGITVFAWPYITPNNIQGSIDATVQAARVPGTAGVILDVEVEWEGSSPTTNAQAAEDLCNGIRREVPNVFLGYTSFGWIGYHANLPFDAFDRTCGDVFMPQVYWSDRGVTWDHGYAQAVEMLNAANLRAPVWMIQSNDATPSGARPSSADLNAFFERAGTYTSLWEWPASGHQTLVDQLPMLHWSNP
jgi:hypothetical protein